LFADVARVEHDSEDEVSPGLCTIAMPDRRIGIRRRDNTCHRRGLGNGEVFKILSEKRFRTLRKSMNGERVTLTQIDLVRVHREYLLFGKTLLQNECDKCLGQFAAKRGLASQKVVSRKLLRTGAAALRDLALLQV
jgi:hypothetical protein